MKFHCAIQVLLFCLLVIFLDAHGQSRPCGIIENQFYQAQYGLQELGYSYTCAELEFPNGKKVKWPNEFSKLYFSNDSNHIVLVHHVSNRQIVLNIYNAGGVLIGDFRTMNFMGVHFLKGNELFIFKNEGTKSLEKGGGYTSISSVVQIIDYHGQVKYESFFDKGVKSAVISDDRLYIGYILYDKCNYKWNCDVNESSNDVVRFNTETHQTDFTIGVEVALSRNGNVVFENDDLVLTAFPNLNPGPSVCWDKNNNSKCDPETEDNDGDGMCDCDYSHISKRAKFKVNESGKTRVH